ncbi:hypothetical protein D3C85_1307260 [compost metagenome]
MDARFFSSGNCWASQRISGTARSNALSPAGKGVPAATAFSISSISLKRFLISLWTLVGLKASWKLSKADFWLPSNDRTSNASLSLGSLSRKSLNHSVPLSVIGPPWVHMPTAAA